MRAHLRLAERQGLLRGYDISPIQSYALVILNFMDDVKEREREKTSFKKALLARQEFDPEKMFPEWFPPKTKDAESDDDLVNAEEVDYSDVKWQSPTESPEEFEKIMAQIAQGQFTGDDLSRADGPVEIEWTDWQ